MQKLLRLLGYRRTFGGKIVRIQERDNLTSFPPGKFASDEDAAFWFRGEKTWQTK